MNFPELNRDFRLDRLKPPQGKIKMVLDTDTYNEIDDQFAVTYALRSSEQLDVKALYAAPFQNQRSADPGEGMEKSYEEILKLLKRLDRDSHNFVYRGSGSYLADQEDPPKSPAAEDLIERALEGEEDPLYVVAIGAMTNVASAILAEPEIIGKIVVVWLGGQPFHWKDTQEFNLGQDVQASRLIFDCGVPLVHIPCYGVASHLLTTLPEVKELTEEAGSIGKYLRKIFQDYREDHRAYAKEIWDISTIGYLLNPEWVPTDLVHSPILTDQVTWSFDNSRHFIRNATFVHRNPIFGDLAEKLKEEG